MIYFRNIIFFKNDLFDLPNTSMVFGDAKKVLNDLIGELKDLGVGEK